MAAPVLRAVPDHELDTFLQHVSSDDRGQAIPEDWVRWCRSCRCPPGPPSGECEVHAVIEACEHYIAVVDEEIRGLGEPHRAAVRRVPAEDLAALVKRFGPVG